MKILLFNDNPVVQKLVALSAQKTKDELTVASSPQDIRESSCDLLIIDDALYSDEAFAAIKGSTAYKSALLMATRGNAVPAGFDNVINKPFLPTDLVDTLIHIDKHIAASSHETQPLSTAGKAKEEEGDYSIDLEETLSDFESGDEEDETPDVNEDFDFDVLEGFEEELPKTAILDHEEVQEVRELLEDTDGDVLIEDEEEGIELADEDEEGEEEFDFDALSEEEETASPVSSEEELFDFSEETPSEEDQTAENESDVNEPFDFDALSEEEETASSASADDELFDFEEETLSEEAQMAEAESDVTDPFDFDTLEKEGIVPLSAEEIMEDEFDDELLLDEKEFDDLESKIQEAVQELEPEELEMELGEEMFESFKPYEEKSEDEGFDELDMLDERELKLAIGEEVADEPEVYVSGNASASIAAEALGEVMGKTVQWNSEEDESSAELKATPAEGVEALQALLKALANEDVTKSLKGLNISININFGNGA